MSLSILILWAIGIILQATFITVEHKQKMVAAVTFKGLAAVVFCIIGFYGFAFSTGFGYEGSLPLLVFIGLIFGAMGDILLNMRFVFEKVGQKLFLAGIAAFLTGHILYLSALIPLSSSLLICVPVGVVIAAILLFFILRAYKVNIAFKIFGIVYIGAVVLMTSIAVGNCITSGFSYHELMYAIGAILFTVSDLILIVYTFGSKKVFIARIMNLGLYYLGQLLIATSLFLL